MHSLSSAVSGFQGGLWYLPGTVPSLSTAGWQGGRARHSLSVRAGHAVEWPRFLGGNDAGARCLLALRRAPCPFSLLSSLPPPFSPKESSLWLPERGGRVLGRRHVPPLGVRQRLGRRARRPLRRLGTPQPVRYPYPRRQRPWQRRQRPAASSTQAKAGGAGRPPTPVHGRRDAKKARGCGTDLRCGGAALSGRPAPPADRRGPTAALYGRCAGC